MRLTKDMRSNILRKAITNVPTVDYIALLTPVIQNVLFSHMPATVQEVYSNPSTRDFLKVARVDIRHGNQSVYIPNDFYGMASSRYLTIRVDEASMPRFRKGSLDYNLSRAVVKSGLFNKHVEQKALFESVKRRLQSTLDSVTTVKRLYDVLEPELHHLIPREEDKTANLPAAAAPVVDDLKKLGALLPDVPKVKQG
jgi:hypothetical protein